MLTSPVTSPTAPVTAPQSTPSRSRHRGLSYLRSYTHSRLSSSSSHHSNSNNAPSPASNRPRRLSLHRSHSYPPEATGNSPVSASPTAQSGITNGAALIGGQVAGEAEPLSATSIAEQPETIPDCDEMARHRTGNRSGTSAAAATNGTRATLSNRTSDELDDSGPPTIRFYPHQEIPAGRPSLHFSPIARTLPSTSSIIKVGRYSEREGIPVANPTTPSDAPVGFKSKVVSRKHCEFSFQNGSWYIKDVASSSGTFLNHVRLSQPNQASRPFPVKDGDVVQLGIDFRGGEEMIFRCVKIRIECNRTWQQRPNKYNQERHAQLVRKKTEAAGATGAGATATENSGECSICLSSVMPCQSLFVAPCAHVWHFKCIYPLIIGKRYPHFTCPNCRAVWNLEEEVDNDQSDGEWEDPGQLVDGQGASNTAQDAAALAAEANTARDTQLVGAGAGALDGDNDTSMITGNLSMDEGNSNDEQITVPPRVSSSGLLARRQESTSGGSQMVTDAVHDIDLPDALPAIRNAEAAEINPFDRVHSPVSAAEGLSGEGPLTPRNNAGPFVFDGSAGRPGSHQTAMEGSEAS